MWDHRPDPDLPRDRAEVTGHAKSVLEAVKVNDASSQELRQLCYALVRLAREAWDDGRNYQATATPEQRGLRP